MGEGQRSGKFQYSAIPGPGYYKIPGFTDNLIRDISKRKAKNLESKMNKKKGQQDMFDMLDKINNKEGGEINLIPMGGVMEEDEVQISRNENSGFN
jgi:hypothetical protein